MQVVTFTPIDPSAVNLRGRVSKPIIEEFMKSKLKIGQIDRQSIDCKHPSYIRPVLQTFISKHSLPIKLMQRDGELLMIRLDLNDDGSPNPDWKKGEAA
jgi:hypothetical protein